MIEEIKSIINPDVILPIDPTKTPNEGILCCEETSINSEIRKLYIESIPDQAFAFTIDYQPGKNQNKMFQQLSCYFNISNENGINKRCDLILICKEQKSSVWDVLIFDLKSKKPNKKDTEIQLLNSELFFDYTLSLLKYYYRVNIEFKISRAIVTTVNPKKNPTYSRNRNTTGNLFYHAISIKPKNKKASINLGKLLQQVMTKDELST